ncbi:cupin domain-containing protein [Streptomyces mirabilis]|uniref:cupin domain-containing protein n=1 Tax=Streptomyces mirabilis TaxID=68239 RepID=UPI0021C03F10|nr:cupin domain-containing protein [Streptomyces mirabilis]MCT9113810.1 cupin domain-containing protein [Streptomyces mirabilis]
MIEMRIAGGLLTVATLTAATACSTSNQPAHATRPAAAVASPAAMPSTPPTETLKPLLQQALPNVKGKTFTSVIVDFPPNARALPHRHGQAFVYAYVLEGTVRSQLEGKPVTTYHQGENWVEQPAPTTSSPRTPAGPNGPSSWSSSSPTPETSSRSTTRSHSPGHAVGGNAPHNLCPCRNTHHRPPRRV